MEQAARLARRTRRSIWLVVAVLVIAGIAGVTARAGIQARRGPLVRPAHALGPNQGELLGKPSAPVLAANAATCAGDQGRSWPYHDLLFAEQAPENSGALTADRLIQVGARAGVSGARFSSCVRDDTYEPWLRQVTNQGSVRGVNATPTFYVDGKPADGIGSPQDLLAAVARAGH